MTAALVAFWGLTQTDDLSRRVTIQVPVSSASRAIDSLAKQTGARLSTVGSVGDEVIFIDITNQSIRDILTRIAQATNADWRTNSDGSLTLTRSKEFLTKFQSVLVDQRVKNLAKWRTAETDHLDQQFSKESITTIGYRLKRNLGQVPKEEEKDKQSDPIVRAFHRAIRSVDLRAVAQLLPYERIVYSSQPTNSQSPLQSRLLPKMIEEQNLWAETLGKIEWKDDNGKVIELPFLDEPQVDEQINDSFASKQPFRHEPRVALLSVCRTYEDWIEFQFDVFTAEGKKAISLQSGARLDEQESEGNDQHSVFKGLNVPEPTKETQAFWAQNPLSNQARIFYTQTQVNDFLRPGNQELLAQLAHQTRTSVVACLADSDKVESPQGFEFEFKFENSRVTSDKTWTVIKTPIVDIEQRNSADRKTLSWFNNNVLFDREFDPRLYSGLAITGGASLANQVIQTVYGSEADANSNNLFAKLFASLSDDQFERLMKGQIIPYSQLTPTQLRLAAGVVFGKPSEIWVAGEAKSVLGKMDATFELPNGILDGTGISLENKSDDVAYFTDSEEPHQWLSGYPIPGRLEEYQYSFGICGTGRKYADEASLFKFSHRVRYTLRCHLSPSHWFAFDVCGPNDMNVGPTFRFKDLRADLQRRIKEYVPFLSLFELRQKVLAIIEKIKKFDEPDLIRDLQQFLEDVDKRIASIK